MKSQAIVKDDLAARINAAHANCEASLRDGLAHAMAAGQLLLEVKAQQAHGQWLPWLKRHCPKITDRTAQRYMQVARELPQLDRANATRVADLSFRDALKVVGKKAQALSPLSVAQRRHVISRAEAEGRDVVNVSRGVVKMDRMVAAAAANHPRPTEAASTGDAEEAAFWREYEGLRVQPPFADLNAEIDSLVEEREELQAQLQAIQAKLADLRPRIQSRIDKLVESVREEVGRRNRKAG